MERLRAGAPADAGSAARCGDGARRTRPCDKKNFVKRPRCAINIRSCRHASPQLLRPLRPRGGARPDRRDAAVRWRRRADRRGRGLSPHRSGGAQLRRTDAAQRRDVRPAGLRLRLPLLRHPLVRQLRLRGGGLGQRGADPRASSRWRAWRRCAAAAASPTSGCCAPGPGRLCEALGVTIAHNGLALDRPPFRLIARGDEPEIVAGPRIGITKAAELPWRYGLKGSRYLSKPFR